MFKWRCEWLDATRDADTARHQEGEISVEQSEKDKRCLHRLFLSLSSISMDAARWRAFTRKQGKQSWAEFALISNGTGQSSKVYLSLSLSSVCPGVLTSAYRQSVSRRRTSPLASVTEGGVQDKSPEAMQAAARGNCLCRSFFSFFHLLSLSRVSALSLFLAYSLSLVVIRSSCSDWFVCLALLAALACIRNGSC